MTVDKTYSQLIKSGIKLFGEHQYDSITTRDIAKHAQVSLGSLSYHFGSKEQLYIAVAKILIGEVIDGINEFNLDQFQTQSIEEMQQTIIRLIFKFNDYFYSENGISRSNILNREVISDNSSIVSQMFNKMITVVKDQFAKLLTIYYIKANIKINNIDFIIIMMVSIFKNRAAHDYYSNDLEVYNKEIINKMLEIILYNKLIST